MIEYRHNVSQRKVDLMLLYEHPIVYCLKKFWSCHLMNFVTWEGMYCLFPDSVLLHKYMFVVRCGDVDHLKAYDKYVGRGFRLVTAETLSSFGEFKNDRFVGDRWTRRVVFSGAPVEVPEPVRSVQFCVDGTGVGVFVSDGLTEE